MQRIEDLITGDLTINYFGTRVAEGWRVARIEWVRESDMVSSPALPIMPGARPVPYGLQVAEGSRHLEENPLEAAVLMLILEQIVKERRITEIALLLNREGHVTREGAPWRATDVFNLMPRLIEAGPVLLKSEAWTQRRQSA